MSTARFGGRVETEDATAGTDVDERQKRTLVGQQRSVAWPCRRIGLAPNTTHRRLADTGGLGDGSGGPFLGGRVTQRHGQDVADDVVRRRGTPASGSVLKPVALVNRMGRRPLIIHSFLWSGVV